MKRKSIRDPLIQDFCDPAMDVGASIRIPECSNCQGQGHQNGVQITRIADGWTWWCYRCDHGGQVWAVGCSPADSLARLKHIRTMLDKKYQRECRLPDDVESDIPDYFLQWLWSYELDGNDVIDYNMVYSAMWDRLIIPVYISGIYGKSKATGRMIAWVGRTLKESKENPKWHLVREYGIKYVYYSLAEPESDVLVLVEDCISAIKLHRAGFNSVALLTTYVPTELYYGLSPYTVKVWLDPDALGKSLDTVRRFNSVGIRARHVGYHADPKDCPYDEIHRVMGDTL